MFQGSIYIKNGIIEKLIPEKGYVNIIRDNKSEQFYNAHAIPGLVDAHGHVFGLGQKINEPDISSANSLDECLNILQKYDTNRGDWLTGRGWNQEKWPHNAFPGKEELDASFKDVPVYLTRVDGHAAWVNSKALDLAGISASTTGPDGGAIIKDKSGNPTGILIDNAMQLVERIIPAHSPMQIKKYYIDSMDALASEGLSEVHDMDVSPALIDYLIKLDNSIELPVKLQIYASGQQDQWLDHNIKPYEGKKIRIAGVKFFVDGALGSRGAFLLEPYSDDNSTRGLQLLTEKELFHKAKKAIEAGFDVATHAIGDAANRLVLDVYAKLRDEKIAGPGTILRIEHAQIVHPGDLEKFVKYDIIPSIQPVHCTSDKKMAVKRLGEARAKYSYPWKTLFDLGLNPAGGSDFPIESHDPMTGIKAFLHRVPDGENAPWHPEETISIDQAIAAYTINAHKAAGVENKGQIKEGYPAEIILIDNNINIIKLSG